MNQQLESAPLNAACDRSSTLLMPHRLEFLDGLRGLAMLMVLVYHGWSLFGEWQILLPLGHSRMNAAGILQLGHIGVNLFLVLSGFCLFWPFAGQTPRREPSLKEYLGRRCRRILPPYYMGLVFCALLVLGGALLDERTADILPILRSTVFHFLMLQNISPDTITSINGPLWTVALEFHLYLLFPLLFLCYRRFPASAVLFSVFAACTLFRAYAFQQLAPHGSAGQNIAAGYCLAYSFIGRCFEFALGMFLAARLADSQSTGARPIRRWEAGVFGLIFIAAVIEWRLHPGVHFLILTDAAYGIFFAVLLAAGFRAGSPLNHFFSRKWLAWLGFCSYSIYLVHFPLIAYSGQLALDHHYSNNTRILLTLLGILPLCILIGYIFHRLFERPFMQGSRARVS